MELCETKEMMCEKNYRVRFIAEYLQTEIRYDKLHRMGVRYEAGTLDFTPDCSLELLKRQASLMGQYLYVLELRAEIEGIELPKAELEAPAFAGEE